MHTSSYVHNQQKWRIYFQHFLVAIPFLCVPTFLLGMLFPLNFTFTVWFYFFAHWNQNPSLHIAFNGSHHIYISKSSTSLHPFVLLWNIHYQCTCKNTRLKILGMSRDTHLHQKLYAFYKWHYFRVFVYSIWIKCFGESAFPLYQNRLVFFMTAINSSSSTSPSPSSCNKIYVLSDCFRK